MTFQIMAELRHLGAESGLTTPVSLLHAALLGLLQSHSPASLLPLLEPLPVHRAIFLSISEELFCSEPLFSHLSQDRILDLSRSKSMCVRGARGRRGVLSPPQPSVLLSDTSPLHPEVLRIMPQLRTMFGAVNRIALPPMRRSMWAVVRRTPTSATTFSQGQLHPGGVWAYVWLFPQKPSPGPGRRHSQYSCHASMQA